MNKKIKYTLITIVAILIIFAGAFYVYVSDYYRADDMAIAVFQSESSLYVEDHLTIFPSTNSSDTALIFYPGAKVEDTAYLPILEEINQRTGMTCILVKMPFNMAIFNSSAADEIVETFPEVKNWYIGGHSMGGAMASNYASKNQDKVKGLILLGAYIYGDYPTENTLTIYGTFNTSVEEKIDYTENVVVIEGGNHAQFGNYGKQKGDPDATISREEQQTISVDAIVEFLDSELD